jgi:hypothetical protein
MYRCCRISSITSYIQIISKKIQLMKKVYFVICLCFSYCFSFAQGTSGYSGTGANIDVVYHRINWTIDPNGAANYISGTVVTYFKTKQANVSSIKFDLNSSSFPTANVTVKYHGVTCTRTSASNILTITLPSTIVATNTLDSLTITYFGNSPGVVGAAQGYQSSVSGSDNYTGSLSESYEDRDWWPCKADMQDKIDSMEINVTVPWKVATADTFWVASNGVLVDSTITSSNRTFKYKTHYPIPSYLVCLSVGKFTRYYRSVNISGTNVPVVYYLLRSTANKATKVALMDQINLALVAFSNKYGDYPFKLEKHGYYDGLQGAGGMEHQTFSAIASNQYDAKTLAHELMHQWFGDNVSFATWNDLWLAEGFARYSESLVGELVPSLGIDPVATLGGYQSTALSLSTASTYIPDANIKNSNLIWNSAYGSTVYERGCMVISMLRALCGDGMFFNTLKSYQTNLAGKSATTDTLNNYFNRALGVDIKPFFDDFVKGTGNPVYATLWQAFGGGNKRLAISLSQTKNPTNSPVTYFHTPVVLHITGALPANDTTIVIYDKGGGVLAKAGNGIGADVGGNLLIYDLSFTPTGVAFDDKFQMLATGSIPAKVTTLDLKLVDFSVKQNPNYNSASLFLDANSSNTEITLERSADGISFTSLGSMQLVPGSSNPVKYSFNDLSPIKGVNYYRAKYKTSYGQFTYTQVIKIAGNYKAEFEIVNNPARDNLQIKNSADALNGEYNFSIYDASGKLVSQSKHNVSGSLTNLKTNELASGIYMLIISSADGNSETLKFATQK